MRRAIITAALGISLLAPASAMAWVELNPSRFGLTLRFFLRDRYSDYQEIQDAQRNAEVNRIANEMEYQQRYRNAWDLQKMIDRQYFWGPQPPKR